MTYRYLGKTSDGSSVAIEAELIERTPQGNFDTVQHAPAEGIWRELSIHGAVWHKGARLTRERGADGYGQITEYLRDITRPSGALTRADVNRLAEIWERWHLNLMRAGCAHMDLPEDKSYDARMGITCPVTGYKYGSAWLYEPLPEGLWREVKSILAKCGNVAINP